MALFKVSLIVTQEDGIVHAGDQLLIARVEADYIKETSTGYALVKSNGPFEQIVYTVPSGMIVKKDD